MTETSPIVFVEPVARGFRLEVMARSISAIRGASCRPVFVATRADYACGELARHVASTWTDVHFVTSPTGQDRGHASWLDREAVDALLDAVADVVARSARADLVFLGADDYLDALATRLPVYRDRLGSACPFVFLYNAEDRVGQPFGVHATAQGTLESITTRGATLLAFDETLHGRTLVARMAKGLPDPWHGHFSRLQRQRVREAIGLAPHAVLVMANLDRLLDDDGPWGLADVERLAQIPFVHFVLHGSVWTLRSPWFRQLAKRYGHRLIYAGSSRKVHDDIRLIAATDLLLDEDARHARTMALGSGFDREVRHLLLENLDALREFSPTSMKLIRDELDRLADESLNGAFGMQLRSAIRL